MRPIDTNLLLRAYAAGVFPMADSRDSREVYWVEPRKRGILPLDGFHLSRSLRKVVRSDRFTVTADRAFAQVIAACAAQRPDAQGTWINGQIEEAYGLLHRHGHAHSIEVWRHGDVGGDLIGGLYGVTLKDVAKSVGVHHTLLNYYFNDKKALFDAVFARRAVVTSERRMNALDAYETSVDGKPTVEGALRAFLDTDLDLYIQGGEGWRNYAQLGAQVAKTPEWGANLMDQHFDPVVLKLISLLRRALPDCAAEDVFWGYHFVSGALMLTLARTGRIDKLSDGLCKSDDYAAVKERMASFMAAGFLAICERRSHGKKSRGGDSKKKKRRS